MLAGHVWKRKRCASARGQRCGVCLHRYYSGAARHRTPSAADGRRQLSAEDYALGVRGQGANSAGCGASDGRSPLAQPQLFVSAALLLRNVL